LVQALTSCPLFLYLHITSKKQMHHAMREGSTFLLEKEVTALVGYCEENDPDKSISKRAVKKHGSEAERVVDESISAPNLFWRVRPAYDPLPDVLSNVLR